MKVMKRDKRGFTLVELMVTLAISSIALAGMYGVYKAQLQSHVTQNAVVDTSKTCATHFTSCNGPSAWPDSTRPAT